MASIRTKILFFFIMIYGFMGVIIIRLVQLQLYYGEYYMLKSSKNFLRIEVSHPSRAEITDRHQKLLATNKPVYNLIWQGTGARQLKKEQLEYIAIVNSIWPDIIDTTDKIQKAERLYTKHTIKTDLSHEDIAYISDRFLHNKNIMIDIATERVYPFGSATSHIIGYLGDAVNTGKMGLEKLFQSQLCGANGIRIKSVNSFGQNIESFELTKPLSGDTITTTLDIDLQLIAEDVFPNDLIGMLLLYDPQNGDILAALSRPTFDPHIFNKSIPKMQWQQMQENGTFLNRTLGLYPPGSIFKLVTTSAAIEQGVIDQEIAWRCKGYSVFYGRKYWCAHKRQHGKISLKEAVAHSCNTLFFEIAKKMDVDIIAQYAHLFGLGEETGIILHEPKGIIPTRYWKLTTKHEPWWPGETLSVAIGQSFLLVSPYQVVRMIGSIFTGNLVKPRLLLNEPVEKKVLNIKPETLTLLQESMHLVIKEGTGRRLQKIKDLEVYAKTSTAQISSLEKSAYDTSFKEHGWFVVYFKYKSEDPLVLAVLVEKAGNSTVPTEIAKNFIINYQKWCENGRLNENLKGK